MTSGQAGTSNDRAVAAVGGPAGAVWLALAVTPGFTWGKYARVPLSLTLVHLCLHHSLESVLFPLLTASNCLLSGSVCSGYTYFQRAGGGQGALLVWLP